MHSLYLRKMPRSNSKSILRESRKLCQRESKFDNVFLVVEGKEGPNITINGPSSARRGQMLAQN